MGSEIRASGSGPLGKRSDSVGFEQMRWRPSLQEEAFSSGRSSAAAETRPVVAVQVVHDKHVQASSMGRISLREAAHYKST